MEFIVEHGMLVGVELTRRNLETLLAKLDRNEASKTNAAVESSFCMLSKDVPLQPPLREVHPISAALYVKAVENDVHYANRAAGIMHEADEAKISRPDTGVE